MKFVYIYCEKKQPMYILLFFMNFKLSDSTIYYHCPIQPNSKKYTSCLTLENFYKLNFMLYVKQTLDSDTGIDESLIEKNIGYESYRKIFIRMYENILLMNKENCIDEDSLVRRNEYEIKEAIDFFKNGIYLVQKIRI